MSALTLHSFFFPDGAGDLLAADGDTDPWEELKSGLKKELPKVAWKVVGREIKAKIVEVLGVRVNKVLGLGWQRVQTLQEYRDPERHPDGETALVPLVEHTIESHHHPHVDVVVRDYELGSVNLDVSLKLHLEGVLLKIESGRIRETCGGSCNADGDLKATVTTKLGSRDLFAFHREMPSFELGRLFDFGDGIEIPDMSKVIEIVELAE